MLAAIVITSIFGLLIALALIGVVTWALITYVPMPPPLKTILIVVAVVFSVLLAADYFAIDLGLHNHSRSVEVR